MTAAPPDPTIHQTWPEPDLAVLRLGRWPPPKLPMLALGPAWADWIATGAEAAACPPDCCSAAARRSLGADRARPLGAGNPRMG